MLRIAATRCLAPSLKAQAKSLGCEILDADFLNITYFDNVLILEELSDTCVPFVFTSVHAIKAIVQLKSLTLQQKKCFCINGATAQTARDAGFDIIATADDATRLATTIIEKKIAAVMHCTTTLRRTELYDILAKADINVHACEVYGKALNPLYIPDIQGVLFFSPSQIDAFLICNDLPPILPAFCIGKTTADYLSALAHQNIIVASQTNEPAMLFCVYNYFSIL